MKIKSVRVFLQIAMILLITIRGFGQSDTAILNKYLTLINAYVIQPGEVRVNVVNAANVIYAETDTSGYQAELVTIGNDRVVRIGTAEQKIGSDASLFIQQDGRRMSQNAVQVNEQTGLPGLIANSVKLKAILSKTYHFTDEAGTIHLTSKIRLPGTNIFSNEVNLQYDAELQLPVSVSIVKRSLIAYQQNDTKAVQANANTPLTFVEVEGIGTCYVREVASTVTFQLL